MILIKGPVPIAVAVVFLMTSMPASAYVLPNKALTAARANSSTLIRYRGHHWSHWHHRHHHGSSAAAAGIGFAAGALLGSALSSQAYVPDGAVAYCMRRFRSYDPASGTYLGYDGYRHRCP